MSATALTKYSNELNWIPPQSTSGSWKQLYPNQYHGRQRIAIFSLALAGLVAGTDIAALCILPKNARILKIHAFTDTGVSTTTYGFGLMGKDGSGNIFDGTATQQDGTPIDYYTNGPVSDNTTFFGTMGASGSAQSDVQLANTVAQNTLYQTTKDCYLTVAILTTNVSGGSTANLSGYVEYVVD